ncbi:MAG TPA: hypothetical protein H9706_01615 [Candidatus Gemmiger stercorigallinarum]|nr:hypothetical protein [Candidatus Gemmiger stercorigallinarum]
MQRFLSLALSGAILASLAGCSASSSSAIAKLVPDATLGEGLAINYSGGDSMPQDVADWLAANGVNAAQ